MQSVPLVAVFLGQTVEIGQEKHSFSMLYIITAPFAAQEWTVSKYDD